MTSTKWTTARGSEIELITSEITSKVIDADGHKVEVEADGIRINEIKVNGKSHAGELTIYQGVKAIRYGWQGKDQLLVAIPDSTYKAIWGAYDARVAERAAAQAEADQEYEAHRAKMKKIMGY